MRKFPFPITATTLLVLLTAAALGACGVGGGRGEGADGSSARSQPREATADDTDTDTDTGTEPTTAAAEPASRPAPESGEAAPAPAPPAPEADTDPHYLCPEGGTAEVTALQSAVDQGHQPWRLSAADVAMACTLGGAATVEAAGPTSYRVTDPSTGETVLVEVAQPLGPDTIWVVTRVTPVA